MCVLEVFCSDKNTNVFSWIFHWSAGLRALAYCVVCLFGSLHVFLQFCRQTGHYDVSSCLWHSIQLLSLVIGFSIILSPLITFLLALFLPLCEVWKFPFCVKLLCLHVYIPFHIDVFLRQLDLSLTQFCVVLLSSGCSCFKQTLRVLMNLSQFPLWINFAFFNASKWTSFSICGGGL